MGYIKEMHERLVKSYLNPIYFIENEIGIKLSRDQFLMIKAMEESPINLIENNDPYTTGLFLLWYLSFNSDKTVLVGSPTFEKAKNLIDEFKNNFDRLPSWIIPGLIRCNKTTVEFNNGSRIYSQVLSGSFSKDLSVSKLYLNDFSSVDTKTRKLVYNWMAPLVTHHPGSSFK